MKILKALWTFRKSVIIVLAPLILLPLPLTGQSQAANCGYVMCLMAVYWTTEACSLCVTSLLPVILFPFFGIQTADEVSMNYMRQVNFLFVGTIAVCIAIEEWNLHKRFALRILLIFGSRPCWIMLGLMCITAFLSMWLSNASAGALMFPVTIAVCREMDSAKRMKSDDEKNTQNSQDRIDEASAQRVDESSANVENEQFLDNPSDGEDDKNNFLSHAKAYVESNAMSKGPALEKAMLIAVAYSSTLGGITTPVGTPPNFVALGIFGTTYKDKANEVNFVTWFAFCFPLSVICLVITWLWMQLRFFNLRDLLKWKRRDSDKRAHELLQGIYNKLPPMSFAEKTIVIHFCVLVLMWFLRDPKIFTGWKSAFPGEFAKDSTAAMIVALGVFLCPSRSSSFSWMWKKESDALPENSPPLLEWSTFQKKFPWDILILLGAGFAISGACVDSGLSEWAGRQLIILKGTSPWIIALVISLTVSILTEFTSNVATTSIFLPILLGMTKDMKINPILILLSTTLSSSFAFALPIATPTNALAFSYGSLRVRDTLSTGIPLNFICVGLLNVFIHLTGVPIFDLYSIPTWAINNSTTTNNASLTVP